MFAIRSQGQKFKAACSTNACGPVNVFRQNEASVFQSEAESFGQDKPSIPSGCEKGIDIIQDDCEGKQADKQATAVYGSYMKTEMRVAESCLRAARKEGEGQRA